MWKKEDIRRRAEPTRKGISLSARRAIVGHTTAGSTHHRLPRPRAVAESYEAGWYVWKRAAGSHPYAMEAAGVRLTNVWTGASVSVGTQFTVPLVPLNERGRMFCKGKSKRAGITARKPSQRPRGGSTTECTPTD